VIQVIEHLPSNSEALSSNPSTAKEKAIFKTLVIVRDAAQLGGSVCLAGVRPWV
jgi:hypothetical protein